MIVHIENLSQEQIDLLIGTLLGDGHLATKTRGRTWYYDIKHSLAQEDYLNFKYNILKELCKKQPHKFYSRSPASCNFVVYCRFWTRSFSFLSLYGNMFYSYNDQTQRYKKNVPLQIKDYLTPMANSFCLAGLYRLIDVFETIYNIKIVLVPKKKHNVIVGYRLYMYSSNAFNFCDLVRPYIIPSMLYKLNKV